MFIEIKGAKKQYGTGEAAVFALDGVDLSLEKGKICVILGPSGSGKSTLLNMIGGLDSLDEGRIVIDGRDITKLSKKALTAYRKQSVGFVFQFYNLVQNLTALENVELAAQVCDKPLDARETLKNVGLEDRMDNFPSQLSGGEQQRVAIARALAKNPKLLLCDEPTGALDYVTGKAILKLLEDTARKTGMTVVIITHNSALCGMADRVIRVKSGTVSSMETNAHPTPIDEIEW